MYDKRLSIAVQTDCHTKKGEIYMIFSTVNNTQSAAHVLHHKKGRRKVSSAIGKKWTVKKGVEVVQLKKSIQCVFCIRKG